MKLPCRFQINEDVSCRGKAGKVVGVSFTETSVLYDILLESGVTEYKVTSGNLNYARTILRLVKT